MEHLKCEDDFSFQKILLLVDLFDKTIPTFELDVSLFLGYTLKIKKTKEGCDVQNILHPNA